MTGLTLGFNRALRTAALLLGLVALTLQGLAPLCLNTMGATAGSAGVTSIILCTIHGFQTIQLGADGKPLPNAPAPNPQNSTCPLCTGFHAAAAFTAPTLVLLAVPANFGRAPLTIAAALAPSPRPHASYISRAPPGWFVPA